MGLAMGVEVWARRDGGVCSCHVWQAAKNLEQQRAESPPDIHVGLPRTSLTLQDRLHNAGLLPRSLEDSENRSKILHPIEVSVNGDITKARPEPNTRR